MGWAKLDDGFFYHRKVIECSNDAKLLFLASVTHCAGQLTDGFVSFAAADSLARLLNVRGPATMAQLVTNGLWEEHPGGYLVHDYLDQNPTADQELARRARDKERTARFRDKKRNGNGVSNAVTPPATNGVSNGVSSEIVCVPRTRTRSLRSKDNPLSADADVWKVFEHWRDGAGKTNQTLLDKTRKKVIEDALKAYPVEDVLDAVVGWKNSPHHRGENPTGTVYNDLGLLLRGAARIEQFRDLARNATNGHTGPRIV